MNPTKYFRNFAAFFGIALAASGSTVAPTPAPTRRKSVAMSTVRNAYTGKEVEVPTHNVEYFLSRRTNRWSVVK